MDSPKAWPLKPLDSVGSSNFNNTAQVSLIDEGQVNLELSSWALSVFWEIMARCNNAEPLNKRARELAWRSHMSNFKMHDELTLGSVHRLA